MGGWGCPHEADGKCLLINRLLKKQNKETRCVPGMKGCVLYKRYKAGEKEEKKKMKTNPKATTARKPD